MKLRKRLMRLIPPALLPIVAGCGAWTEAQLGLIDQIGRGLELQDAAAERRGRIVERALDDRRAALDEAFDADAQAAGELTPEWVIESRRGYAAGLDGLASQRQRLAEAADADRRNRQAARAAAARLKHMLEVQNQLKLK